MQNLFGLAAGPLLTGFLSDAYGLPFALSRGARCSACSPRCCSSSPRARTNPISQQRRNASTPSRDGALKPQAA